MFYSDSNHIMKYYQHCRENTSHNYILISVNIRMFAFRVEKYVLKKGYIMFTIIITGIVCLKKCNFCYHSLMTFFLSFCSLMI